MVKNKFHHDIIEQVPVDYYQKGVKINILQRIWHTQKLRTVKSFMENNPDKVLDVGCASGWFISNLVKDYPGSKGYGIDIYKNAIFYGNKKYPKVALTVADAHKIPYESNYFDLIVCTEVLEHVENPKTVLREIKRVLKPKGRLIIELDSGSILFSIVWYLWLKSRGGVWNHSHLHSFNTKKLARFIGECELTIIDKKTFNFGMAMAFCVTKE